MINVHVYEGLRTSQELYGKFERSIDQHRDVKAFIEHMREELDEFEASENPCELADIFLLTMMLAHFVEVDLAREVSIKSGINEKRSWGAFDENGIRHHVPGIGEDA